MPIRAATMCLFMALLLTLVSVCWADDADPRRYDVLVYGASAGGCLSAVAAAQSGARTALLCNTWPDCFPEGGLRVGGLTTGGLGMTDSCHQSDGEPTDTCQLSITGGLTEIFYNRSASHYGDSPKAAAKGRGGPNMPYNLEPHVALEILEGMLKEANVTVLYGTEVKTVDKEGTRLTTLHMEDGRSYSAKVFVDASYEGDLFARAGVDYIVGREANTTYNESMAGRRLGDHKTNEFAVRIDPYNHTTGKLLAGVMNAKDALELVKRPGDGDSKVMVSRLLV
jgi:hypothetical protein